MSAISRHNNFIVLPEARSVLCLTAKCASTSIIQGLLEYYGAEGERPYHDTSCFSWMNLAQVRRYVPKYRRAMFVRNPFDRLVGTYEYHIVTEGVQAAPAMKKLGFRADITFAHFLDLVFQDIDADPHYCVQARQCDNLDFTGKFEELPESWSAFRDWLGLELPDLKIVNKGAPRKPYRDYYPAQTRLRVSRAYALDCKTFGYGFGS